MKKHKILIVALALVIMCTGAGYAYWTQTLTINNSVTTGNLNVHFIDPADVEWETDNHLDSWRNYHTNLVTVDADIDEDYGQYIDFTVGNFYPGAGASLSFVVENNGSVAARITEVKGTILENTALCNALNYKFDRVEIYIDGLLSGEYIFNVDADDVDDLATGLTDALNDITIDPGETLSLKSHGSFLGGLFAQEEAPGYGIVMPDSIGGSQFEGATGRFSLGLTFEQVN